MVTRGTVPDSKNRQFFLNMYFCSQSPKMHFWKMLPEKKCPKHRLLRKHHQSTHFDDPSLIPVSNWAGKIQWGPWNPRDKGWGTQHVIDICKPNSWCGHRIADLSCPWQKNGLHRLGIEPTAPPCSLMHAKYYDHYTIISTITSSLNNIWPAANN